MKIQIVAKQKKIVVTNLKKNLAMEKKITKSPAKEFAQIAILAALQ